MPSGRFYLPNELAKYGDTEYKTWLHVNSYKNHISLDSMKKSVMAYLRNKEDYELRNELAVEFAKHFDLTLDNLEQQVKK